MGASSMIGIVAVVEGVALYIISKKNKTIKISKIAEDANESVKAMPDSELHSKLEDELSPK
jgi:hypothetical protein